MNVADDLVAALQQLGVTHVFGLPGSTEGPLLDALSRVDTPRYILGLHENIVTAMADGYARESGRLGVVSLHTSVGSGNAISQLMNSSTDRSPVLAIVGHKDAGIANRDGFCTMEDLPGMFRPFTKWSRQVELAEQAVEDLHRAASIALAAPSGPVALVVTEDRARASVKPGEDDRRSRSDLPLSGGFRPDDASIARAVELIAAARRPVIIAGDGVSSSAAHAELDAFARACSGVVLQEPRRSAARMNIDTTHPSYCGEYDASHPAVIDTDLIIALGARVFVEFEPMPRDELPPGVPFIHVHEDPAELGKRYVPDLALVGTVRATLQALLAAGPDVARADSDHVRSLRERHEQRVLARRVDPEQNVLTIAAASCVLDELLSDDVILIDEGIRSSRILLQHLSVPATRSYHRNTGGAIGWGLPAAVGASFARPDRPVALFVGDGSALMTIQSLWTAAQHGCDLTVFVSNNLGYQAVQAAVEKHHEGPLDGPAVGAAISGPDPDFVHLAQGFGVPAVAVHTVEELRSAIAASTAVTGPMVIDMRLDAAEHVGNRR
jgi:benzoylformate decarboxylase